MDALMAATAARSNASVPGAFRDDQLGNAAIAVDGELNQHASTASHARALGNDRQPIPAHGR